MIYSNSTDISKDQEKWNFGILIILTFTVDQRDIFHRKQSSNNGIY
jgi:hypothetical protein